MSYYNNNSSSCPDCGQMFVDQNLINCSKSDNMSCFSQPPVFPSYLSSCNVLPHKNLPLQTCAHDNAKSDEYAHKYHHEDFNFKKPTEPSIISRVVGTFWSPFKRSPSCSPTQRINHPIFSAHHNKRPHEELSNMYDNFQRAPSAPVQFNFDFNLENHQPSSVMSVEINPINGSVKSYSFSQVPSNSNGPPHKVRKKDESECSETESNFSHLEIEQGPTYSNDYSRFDYIRRWVEGIPIGIDEVDSLLVPDLSSKHMVELHSQDELTQNFLIENEKTFANLRSALLEEKSVNVNEKAISIRMMQETSLNLKKAVTSLEEIKKRTESIIKRSSIAAAAKK